MDQGQRAVVIVGMLAEAFHALEADADVEQVMCGRLAEALKADAGICYVADGESGVRALSCYPDSEATGALLAWAGSQAPALLGDPPMTRSHPDLGHVLVLSPEPATDGGFESGNRSLAFACSTGFGAEDLALLREAKPVLSALLPHVVDATARRERAEAGRQAAREFGLTSRELEVLELLAQGLLATSIASRLSLSPRTVHKHLGNIYDKLGVHDRLVAVSLARGRGLVDA